MRDELDERARALLAAVVTEERAADDAEVVALARSDAAFRARLEALRATQALLERAAADQRETQRAAREFAHAPGESRLRVPGARRVSAFAWLALAAAGVALCVFLLRERRSPAPAPVWLGDGTVRLVRPRGTVESFAPIEWEGRASSGAEYRVVIAPPGGGAPLLEHRTSDTRWNPTPEELAQLPREIRVEVTLHVDGAARASDAAEARR